jgi:hypothetical protein
MLNLNLIEMAKITPIDVIKGITGKYGSGSNDYFATNKSSNKIHLAKLSNPYKGPASEKQLAQQSKFAARQAAVSAWLNANKPSEKNGAKGTEAYQLAQKLKKTMHFSCISQVIYKYLDEEGTIKLPAAHPDLPGGEGEQTGGGGSTNPTPSPSTGDDDNGGDSPEL